MASGLNWPVEQDKHKQALAESIRELRSRYPDVPVTIVVSQGGPAQTLLRYAQNARMVVVGSRGRGEVAGRLLGSVSRHLIYHAACPVLVSRRRPDDTGDTRAD